jgi:hypothetical protein
MGKQVGHICSWSRYRTLIPCYITLSHDIIDHHLSFGPPFAEDTTQLLLSYRRQSLAKNSLCCVLYDVMAATLFTVISGDDPMKTAMKESFEELGVKFPREVRSCIHR